MAKLQIHHYNDKIYKKYYSHKDVVESFIKGFVSKELFNQIETIELVDKEFISKKYQTFTGDLIQKIKLKHGEIYILLLFEFKPKDEKGLALDLLNYICLFYKSLIKTKKYDSPLPPVLPIVI